MRKRNVILKYSLSVALLFLLSSVFMLVSSITESIPASAATINAEASFKSNTEKVNHQKKDAVDHINRATATILFHNTHDFAVSGASLKQKNLIDADNTVSFCAAGNIVIQKGKQHELPFKDNHQKILLLFPFHSFW